MSEQDTPRLDTPGLDLAAFRGWYDAERPGELAQTPGGEVHAVLITGGKSNLTYDVTDGTTSLIVRRPPLGHVQATAHDMSREFAVMNALRSTDVPVPRTLAHCTDDSVLGAPFYVMEKVDGTPYRNAEELESLGPERTGALARQLVDVLARLHAVEPEAVGLGQFGRPSGFLERQVRRWGKQLEGSKTQERPAAQELHRLLAERIPDQDAAWLGIVHGDYRLDNVLVDGEDRIRAVVDWEMSTLGDTRTDLALMLVYDDLARGGARMVSDVSTAPGYPAADQQLAAYADTSGRVPGDMGWHLALGYFKLAVILEGIHYRYLHGQTVGDGFDQIGEGFDAIVAAGLDAVQSTSKSKD